MATHVIIDAASFPAARPYYTQATVERTKSGTMALTADNVYDIDRIDLKRVLDKIIDRASSSDSIVIVCHGTDQGMSIWLKRDSKKANASTDALNLLSSGRSAADICRQLFLTESATQELMDRMAQVRALNLTRVEIRGCNIGQYSSTMSAIKRFFGSATVGAPAVRNSYANIRFNTNGNDSDFARIENHDGQVFDVPSGRVGFEIQMTAHSAYNVRNLWASSTTAVHEWQAAMFSFRSNQSGRFSVHGQFVSGALIFPKQAAYVENLAEFCGEDDLGIPLECREPAAATP